MCPVKSIICRPGVRSAALYVVLCSHVTFGIGQSLGDSEWLEVYLAKCSIGNNAVRFVSLKFLIIADLIELADVNRGSEGTGLFVANAHKVLESCGYPLRLHPSDVLRCDDSAQKWIFAVHFESSSAQWVTRNVDRGSEQNMCPFGL